MGRAGPPDVVVGGGIVGLSVARAILLRSPDRRVVVLEKEPGVARHQTSHSSNVLHSGLYYAPGSLKARTCTRGRAAMIAYCEANGIPWRRTGKVVVATHARELPRMEALLERGKANGVACERIGPGRLAEIEPAARGVAAIHVPDAGIVDFARVARRLAAEIGERGGEVRTGARVTAIDERAHGAVIVTDGGDPIEAARVVTCGGLFADRLARMTGDGMGFAIVPFRGAYRRLVPEARGLCRGLVYPVPDPRFPFLGVHLTRTLDDEVLVGPGAALALGREAYDRRGIRLTDLFAALAFRGTRRFLLRHLGTALAEAWRGRSTRGFARAAARLVPALRPSDLLPAPAGIRAQAMDRRGRLADDFVLEGQGPVLHVLSAPSPAATASLAIAEAVVDRLQLSSR